MRSGSDDSKERYRRFVADTMAKRIPLIIRNTEDGCDAETAGRLRAISRAVAADAPMVVDLSYWPFEGWEEMPARINGKRISAAAFFDFEFWMYFRILDAVRFGETRLDPFRAIKHRDLDRHLQWADEAIGRTTTLTQALNLSLEANAHDLSQLAGPSSSYEVGRDQLQIEPLGMGRLNIVTDNFGGEFVADLVLAIVAAEAGTEVVVHVKQLPMFVSDTTADDVTILFDRIDRASPFGSRLQAATERGGIRFATHPFWSAPKFFDRMPVSELGIGEVLTVVKGDLNFRRLIGDVSVPVDSPFQSLAVLPSAPVLSLRSVKSYCLAGMTQWPARLPRTNFPMDGSIVAVQRVPKREAAIVSAESSSGAASPLRRALQWLQREV